MIREQVPDRTGARVTWASHSLPPSVSRPLGSGVVSPESRPQEAGGGQEGSRPWRLSARCGGRRHLTRGHPSVLRAPAPCGRERGFSWEGSPAPPLLLPQSGHVLRGDGDGPLRARPVPASPDPRQVPVTEGHGWLVRPCSHLARPRRVIARLLRPARVPSAGKAGPCPPHAHSRSRHSAGGPEQAPRVSRGW